MSNLKVAALLRKFQFDGIRIPYPGPEWSLIDSYRALARKSYSLKSKLWISVDH